MTMTLDLAALKEIEAKATPGPWKTSPASGHVYSTGGSWWTVANAYTDTGQVCRSRDGELTPFYLDKEQRDATLIAAARNALPELIAEVERLREELHRQKFERDSAVAELIRVRRIYGDSVLGFGCSDEQINIALPAMTPTIRARGRGR